MNAPAPLTKPTVGAELQAAFDTFIKAAIERKPPRIVLNAVPGFGKTSTIAHAPDAVLITARGETGYGALLGAGLVPAIPVAHALSWASYLRILDKVRNGTPACKVLGIDTIGSIERLLHEYICDTHFKGDWSEKGFLNFQKGYERAVPDWLLMLDTLDAIHEKGIAIVLLSHAQVRTFKNPLGEDFDRWVSDLHPKTWNVTHRWADCVFFGKMLSIIDTDSPRAKKGKGIGGTERVLYCEYRDAYDAKNRYGMEAEYTIPNQPKDVWPMIWNAITRKGA